MSNHNNPLSTAGYDYPIYTVTIVASSTISYVGENLTQGASTSATTWRVKRIAVSGSTTYIQYAGTGKFEHAFTSPASLFSDVPFANQYSIQFTNSNKRITVPHHSTLSFERTDAFSISLWSKSDSTTTWTWLMKKAFIGSGIRGYEINRNTGNVYFELMSQDSTYACIVRTNSTTQQSDGNWHFWAFTYDGSSTAAGMKIYIDGVDQTTVTTADTVTGGPSSGTIQNSNTLNLGYYSAGFNHFNGYMDEISIHSSNLSAAEVVAMYNLGKPIDLSVNSGNYASQGTQVSWWRFTQADKTSVTTITDQRGSNHGTTTNITGGNFVAEVP